MKYTYRFDNVNFNKQEFLQYVDNDSKLSKLKSNLVSLLANDKGIYKHVIYSSSTKCAKMICGLLQCIGLFSAYNSQHQLQITEGYRFFAYLTINNVYGKPISKTLVKSIKSTFNQRPDNVFGDKIMFIVIDKHFKEGIDLFDVKYMHLFSKITNENEENQVIGRIRRSCGHIGLPDGTKQIIFSYYPETLKKDASFSSELKKICYYASIDCFKSQDIYNLLFGRYITTLKTNFNIEEYSTSSNVLDFREQMYHKYSKLFTETSSCFNSFKLSPTQKMIKDYFTPGINIKGILCWHPVGSGKTCLGLGVASNFVTKGYQVIWVSKNSLLKDIEKNKEMCYGLKTTKLLLPVSYKTFTNLLQNKNRYARKNLDKTLIIIDEAHKLFDNSLSTLEKPDIDILRKSIQSKTCKVLLMTATPFMSDPMQLIKILNLIVDNPMPHDFQQFKLKYLEDDVKFSYKGGMEFIENIYKHISVSSDNSKYAIQVKNEIR